MPRRQIDSDLFRLPDDFWDRPDITTALASRDIAQLFRLVLREAGASQTQLAIAVGLSQPEVSEIINPNHRRRVTSIDVLTRIATGLNMPDKATAALLMGRTPAPTTGDPPPPPVHSTVDKAAQPFARALRALRTTAGLSLMAIAKRTGYSRLILDQLERGTRAPTPEQAAKLDQALKANGYLTDLAPAPKIGQALDDALNADGHLIEVAERQDTAHVTPRPPRGSFVDAVLLPDGGTAAELVELSRALDQRSIGRGELTAAELTCAHLDHRYAQLGPNKVLPQVRSLLSATITHLDQPQPLHHHRRLRILAGRLAGLRTWLCFDLGQDDEAERWYDLAVSAALDAEEWSLAAWLLGGRSLIPSLRHDHRRAVALIDRAVAIVNSGADNTTRAWVYALHARGRAGLGDQDGFEESSAQALTAAEHSTVHERRHGMDFVNGSLDLRYYTGTSRLLLHQPAHAVDMLRGSLDALPTEHTKAHAVLTLNLADAAAQTGEIDEAISLTRNALTSAGHQPILPILHQARRIRTVLGADHAGLATDLDDDLHQFAAALTAIAAGSEP